MVLNGLGHCRSVQACLVGSAWSGLAFAGAYERGVTDLAVKETFFGGGLVCVRGCRVSFKLVFVAKLDVW